MRIIAVVMGEPDSLLRNQEVSEMLDYSFAQYEITNVLKSKTLGKYEVDKAKKKYVEIIPEDDVTILKKKGEKINNVTYDVSLKKISAPFEKNESVGILKLKENGKIIRNINLIVKEDVKKATLFELYIRYLKDIFTTDTFLKN